jgi:hypothetical protein
MKKAFTTFLSKLQTRYLVYLLVLAVAFAVFPLLASVAAIVIIAAETRFESRAKKKEEAPDRAQPPRQTTTENVAKLVLLLLLGAVFIYIAANIVMAVGNAVLKSDNALTTENMIRVSKHLEAYKTEHGSYPPQQDMRSLLETLGIRKSDFRKTYFFDLDSATYHAPPEDSTDPEDRFITMRVKWHLFEGYDDHLLFLRRDGTVGTEYLKDRTQEPERKPDSATSVI